MEDDGFIPYHDFNVRCQLAWCDVHSLFWPLLEPGFITGWNGYATAYKDAKAGKTPRAKWITQFTIELLK